MPTQRVTLELNKGHMGPTPIVEVRVGETDQYLEATLMDGGLPYEPPEDAVVLLQVKRRDGGLVRSNPFTKGEGPNVFTGLIPTQSYIYHGVSKEAFIAVYHGDAPGPTTQTMQLSVLPGTTDETAVKYFDAMINGMATDLEADVDANRESFAAAQREREEEFERTQGENASAFTQAEQGRQSAFEAAESARAEAETGRVEAESARAQAETLRESAETGRVEAESSRADSEDERDRAETQRKANEEARQSAETLRSDAETLRESAETARSEAESRRDSAETLRAESETAREVAEDERESAEALRQANEEARVQAEAARAEAESARERASSEAVTAAEAATAGADTAAGNADRAASEADAYIEGLKGQVDAGDFDGGYYVPTLTEDGDLSWEATREGMDPAVGANIRGPKGDRGEKGEKGDTGAGLNVLGKYDSEEALREAHPSGDEVGDAYLVATHYWFWDGSDWVDGGELKGAKGDTGPQGPPGENATVTELASVEAPGLLRQLSGSEDEVLLGNGEWGEYHGGGGSAGPLWLEVDEAGDLYAYYDDGSGAPNLDYDDESGNLYAIFETEV